MAKPKEKNEAKEFLHIKISKPINEVVDQYCKLSGVEPRDLGYHEGVILANTKHQHLGTVSNIHFFAGMMFVIKGRKGKDYDYEKMDKKQHEEFMKKMMEEVAKAQQPELPKLNYLG